MKIIRKFVEQLPLHKIKEIISDFEQFEKEGMIGDCLLRSSTRELLKEYDINNTSIVIWMQYMANDCYRIIAERAMERGIIKPEFFRKD